MPECETLDKAEMQPPWLELAVPVGTSRGGGADPCSRYAPLPGAGALAGAEGTGPWPGLCSGAIFSNVSVQCEQRVYPNKDLSIMTEVRSCSSGAATVQ